LKLPLPQARVTDLVALSSGRGKSLITDAISLRKQNRSATSQSNKARDPSPTGDGPPIIKAIETCIPQAIDAHAVSGVRIRVFEYAVCLTGAVQSSSRKAAVEQSARKFPHGKNIKSMNSVQWGEDDG